MKKLPILLLLLLIIPSMYAQSLTISPGWSVSIPASTITEAGLNYTTTTITSATSQSLMSITAARNTTHTVYVQKTDVSWDPSLIISVRRSGNGSAPGGSSITNGTTFQQVTGTATYFFELTLGG